MHLQASRGELSAVRHAPDCQRLNDDTLPEDLSEYEVHERHFDAAESSRMDGLRLDFPGKWLLVRASNTEPIVRLIAEASSMDDAKGLCDEAETVIA